MNIGRVAGQAETSGHRHWAGRLGAWGWFTWAVRKRVLRDPDNSPSSRSSPQPRTSRNRVHRDRDGELGPCGGGGHPLLPLSGRHLPRRRRISGMRHPYQHLTGPARCNFAVKSANSNCSAPPFGAGARLAPVCARRVEHRPRGRRALLEGLHGAAPWQGNEIGTTKALLASTRESRVKQLVILMASGTARTDHALMFRCPCNSPASRLQRPWLWLRTTEH